MCYNEFAKRFVSLCFVVCVLLAITLSVTACGPMPGGPPPNEGPIVEWGTIESIWPRSASEVDFVVRLDTGTLMSVTQPPVPDGHMTFLEGQHVRIVTSPDGMTTIQP